MNIDDFWTLIDLIDIKLLDEEDEEGALEKLVGRLSQSSVSEIHAFDEHLSRTLYDIDGIKWADESGESQSDDSFLYLRCYVVAKGRAFYESVKSDPTKMPKELLWAESLLYVTMESWAEVTGNDEEDYEYDAAVSYETGSNRTMW